MRLRFGTMMGGTFGVVAALVACGGFSGGEDAAVTDAGADALAAEGSAQTPGVDAAGDAAVFDAGPSCALTTPFGQPTALTTLNVHDRQTSPRLTPDELTVYFSVLDAGSSTFLLYTASRAHRSDDFGAPALVPSPPNGGDADVNDDALDPVISPDQLDLYFSSSRQHSPNQIYVSHRSAPDAGFGQATLVTPDDGVFRYAPSLGPSNVLWFVNDVNGATGPFTFWNADRDGGNAHQVTIEGQATAAFSPAPSPDGAVLYFTAYRVGYAVPQVFRASCKGDATYGDVTAVEELSAPAAGVDGVRPGFVSPDGCRIYYSFDPGGSKDLLFVAEKKLP